MQGPPAEHSFWRAGELPIFNGETHKQRVFITYDSNATFTEITDQADLIQEVLERCPSRLFPEPTGDVLLIYDKSAEENGKSYPQRSDYNLLIIFIPVTPLASEPEPLSIPTLVRLCNPLQAADNPKTQWIFEQFNKPYVCFNSVHSVPKVPLPDTLTFVTQGTLVVSKRTQARLVLWRAQHPQIPMWFLAYRCLSLGMDWRVFCPPSTLTTQPSDSTPANLQATPRPLMTGTSFFVEYARNVHTLLQLPRARRFITMGGILWRIALHYGPSQLFASAISGPSSDALNLNRCEAHDALVDDCVSDEDISLLLGVTDRGSVWPTLDLWEKNENWSGEWGEKCERWFTGRIREIARGSPSAMLTRQQWKATVRHRTLTAFKSHRTLGTEAHAAWVCSELETLFPPPEPLALESP